MYNVNLYSHHVQYGDKTALHFAAKVTVNDEPLNLQCRCIVAVWMGGFGGLMQWSLTRKVHEPVNAAS